MPRPQHPWRQALALFTLVFLIHGVSPNATSSDSVWTVFTALSLIDHGDTDLDEYPGWLEAARYSGTECVDRETYTVRFSAPAADCVGGRRYSWYPVAVPVLAAPLVWGVRKAVTLIDLMQAARAARRGIPALHGVLSDEVLSGRKRPILAAFLSRDLLGGHAIVEVLVASWLMALTATVLFVVARRPLPDPLAMLVALVFAFATPAWSVGSRALWQHGPSMLLLALALYLLMRAEEDPWYIQFASLPLAAAYTVRPTNALAAAVLTVFVARQHRKFLVRYLLWALPVALAFAAYNLHTYRALLPSYFLLQPALSSSPAVLASIGEAMAGGLISPSRGLLVFTPVLIFSLYGMWLAGKNRWHAPLSYYLMSIIALHWLTLSLYFQWWWGGYSFGPRFFSDMIPYLVFFLIPALERLRAMRTLRGLLAKGFFAVMIAASLFIHARGAWSWQVHAWNEVPNDIDTHRQRLWDWHDIQFLRGL